MNKPVKIIYIHHRPYPHKGKFYEFGSDYYFFFGEGQMFVQYFKKYNIQHDFHFEVWRGEAGLKKTLEKKVMDTPCKVFPAKHYKKFGNISFELLKKLKEEQKKNNILIHYTASPHKWELYLILFLFRNTPIFANHQGGANPLWKLKNQNRYFNIVSLIIEKILYKRVDLFFAGGNVEAPYLMKMSSKQKVIFKRHWGLDDEELKAIDKDAAKKKLGLDANKKYLLVAGKLQAYRGIKQNIEVRDELRKRFNYDVEVINVGATEQDKDYEYAHKNGVILFGRVPRNDLHLYFSAADIYLYLVQGKDNIDFAGIGGAPLEALMCNTPAVGNTIRHMPDLIENNIAKYTEGVDDSVEAIHNIFSNPEKYQNSRQYMIDNLSWKSIVSELKGYYDYHIDKYYGEGNLS